jgi:hypothetical protein
MIAAYLWIIILNILAKLLFYPRVSEGYSLGKRLSYGEFSPEVYSFTWIKQSFRHNGLKLRYDILPLSPSRWCFLVHGAGARPHSMYKHLTFWREKRLQLRSKRITVVMVNPNTLTPHTE